MNEPVARSSLPPTNRYAHFHAGDTFVDKNGVSHTGKGRLVATVCTLELPDGTIAVGAARVNPKDNPVRFIGRQRAKSRLDRLLATIRVEEQKGSQAATGAQEREDMLAFRMDRDVFVSAVIRGGIFRKLAEVDARTLSKVPAESDAAYRRTSELLEELRALTLSVP